MTTSWIIWTALMNVPVTGIVLTPQAHLATQRDCGDIKNSCSLYDGAVSQFPVSGSHDLSMPPLPHGNPLSGNTVTQQKCRDETPPNHLNWMLND